MLEVAVAKLFQPTSIALVGASESSPIGRAIVENVIRLGYAGRIHPVNPKYHSVLGITCYQSIRDIPEPVDAALIATPGEHVLGILRECADAGIQAVVVAAGGFGELEGTGREREDELRELAATTGMAICGPNCMGILNTVTGGSLYIGQLRQVMPVGNVSAVVQSGYLGMALADNRRGVYFRYVVSSGNETVVDSGAYVRFLATDPGTRVIALALEGVRDAEGLLAGIRAAKAAGKAVMLLKLAGSEEGRKLAVSHTGALAGLAEVTKSVCAQEGIGLVNDLEQLLLSCKLATTRWEAPGPRMAVFTLSGGASTLVADLVAQSGLQLAAWSPRAVRQLAQLTPSGTSPNPFDAWAAGRFAHALPTALTIAMSEPDVAVIAIIQDLPPEASAHNSGVPAAVIQAASEVAVESSKPLVMVGTLAERPAESLVQRVDTAGIPYVNGLASGIAAIEAWSQSGRRSESGEPAALEHSSVPLEVSSLSGLGLPMVAEQLSHTAQEAVAAADHLGYPVVLKVQSKDIPHKSDFGGVSMNVRTGHVANEYKRLLAKVRSLAPEARIDGVLVQKQVAAGTEVVVSALRDPDWGWVVAVGLGGIFVAALSDLSFRRAPVSEVDAVHMITALRGAALLTGARGRPAADVPALAGLVATLSRIVLVHGHGWNQIEFNPVVVFEAFQGVRIVDTLIVPDVQHGQPRR